MRGHRRWRPWRTALFLLGLVAILAALISPIDRLALELFSVHMVQHMLLMVVAAPLLWLGAPIRPLLLGLPLALRHAVVRPLARSSVIRGLLHALRLPLVSAAFYILGLYLWHLPLFYDAAIADERLHVVEHLYFLISALLFWSAVIDPEPFRASLPYPARIAYLLLTGAAQNTILGGLLAFSSRLFYTHYKGVDALSDQRLGGVVMWVPGDLIFLAAASAAFFLWLKREEEAQLARERRSS